MTSSGPVSAFLEQRLLSALNDKKLVVWLDAEGAYTEFVDALIPRSRSKDFPVPVLAFRDSFLDLMLALEHEGSTLDRPLLLVHLPGFNNQGADQSTRSVRKTPLLELHEAGHSLQLNLATIVGEAANGRVPLAEIDAFLARPRLTLSSADAWLSGASSASGPTRSDWFAKLSESEFVHQLTGPNPETLESVSSAVQQRAATLFGTDAPWFTAFPQRSAEAVVAWILCVEFVHDLRRPPRHPELLRLTALPAKTVDRCKQEAVRLRKEHPERYRTWALALEPWVRAHEETRPEDLGRIDTFQFEALTIYGGAVRALAAGEYAKALAWCEAHEASQGFWVQHSQDARWAWMLLGDAARLGVALEAAPRPLDGVGSLEEAVERYASTAAPVDLAHRRFEQRHAQLYGPQLPEFSELSLGFDRVRQAWSAWADVLSRSFATLCRNHGALPPAELQQRTLFDQVVLPLLSRGDKVALFVLDALRFEMALELREDLAAAGVQVELRARLAELPTITAVGMNALAPIERSGRLAPVIKDGRFTGFRAGEASIVRPEDRHKAIAARVPGKPPLHLELDALGGSLSRIKNQVAQAQLIVVHGLELDTAGESGLGVHIFGDILRRVVAARRQLEQAGVQQFVFTSDHGFLLQRGSRAVDFGSHRQPDRRYAFSDIERTDKDHLSVSLQSLGYDAPGHLVFREDTAQFAVGRPPGAFTHGGNSLQERVIPVLVLSRRRATAEETVRWTLELETATPLLNTNRVRVRVKPARDSGQAALDFASAQAVDVSLRLPEPREDVRVVVKDAVGAGVVTASGGLRLQPGTSDWAEVCFALEGTAKDRLPVLFVLDSDRSVTASPAATYPVLFVAPPNRPQAPEPSAPAPSPPMTGWAERLGDADAGKVFDYLQQHGNLNEQDLVQLLGHPRKARAFAARFDAFRDRVTFDVEVVMTADGKRYQVL